MGKRMVQEPGSCTILPAKFAAMSYGRALEAHALDIYRATRPKVHLFRFGLAISPEFPWLACSPDAVVRDFSDGSLGLVEVKCPTTRLHQSLEQCPEYVAQVQGTMGLLRLDWCDFIVWSHQQGLMVHRVSFDLQYFKKLLQQLHTFYFNRFIPFILEHTHLLESESASWESICQAKSHGSTFSSLIRSLELRGAGMWLLLQHMLKASPMLLKERLTFGKYSPAGLGDAHSQDRVRLIRVIQEQQQARRLVVWVLFRPEPIVLVAGGTWPWRDALRQQMGLSWCPNWRGWRSSRLSDCSAAEALVHKLISFFDQVAADS